VLLHTWYRESTVIAKKKKRERERKERKKERK
jgi:hypothetical protein